MAGYPINPYFQNALARYAGGGMNPGFMRPGMPVQYPVRMPQPIQSGPIGMPAQGAPMPSPVGFEGGPTPVAPPARAPIAFPVRGTAMRPTGPAALPTGGMNSLRGYANL